MNWYYRTLLSYAPIFFVVISAVIFFIFSVLNDSARKQVSQMQQTVSVQTLEALDRNLKAVERSMVQELMKEGPLQDFFEDKKLNTVYDYFLISQELDDLSDLIPFENSVYVYREKDDQVLTHSGLFSLEEFGDKAYLERYYYAEQPTTWSLSRSYSEYAIWGKENVVSMMKKYPYAAAQQGALVVNIQISDLNRFIHELSRHDAGDLVLFSAELQPVDHVPAEDERSSGYVQSEYTGWYLHYGGKFEQQFSILQQISQSWILFGVIIIAGCLAWFTYVTHRHYRPIQRIIGEIKNYSRRKSEEFGQKGTNDEFIIIQSAIEGFLKTISQYEKDQQDNKLFRQRQLFIELLSGEVMLSDDEPKKIEGLPFPSAFHELSVVLLEIDHSHEFKSKYDDHDQYLLKFAIHNVIQETAEKEGLLVRDEWIEPNRMGAIYFWNASKSGKNRNAALKNAQKWISEHLDFTISIALGMIVDDYSEVHRSYDEARKNLAFKPVFGTGSFIETVDIQEKATEKKYSHLVEINAITEGIRLEDGKWRERLDQLFASFKDNVFSRHDIEHAIQYLIYRMNKELEGLSDDIQNVWANEYLPSLESAIARAETVDDYQRIIVDSMNQLEAKLGALRSQSNSYELIKQVRDYIHEHYADPEMSLNQISEHFGLNSRYLSKMFKEKFGEKFIDYVIKVRVEKARQMLLETSLSIQEISEKVGYIHVISFHRAFKKNYGITPGEYRKKQNLV